jgi:hypothetical protein
MDKNRRQRALMPALQLAPLFITQMTPAVQSVLRDRVRTSNRQLFAGGDCESRADQPPMKIHKPVATHLAKLSGIGFILLALLTGRRLGRQGRSETSRQARIIGRRQQTDPSRLVRDEPTKVEGGRQGVATTRCRESLAGPLRVFAGAAPPGEATF